MSLPEPTRENGIGVEPLGFTAARAELLRLTRRRQYAALATQETIHGPILDEGQSFAALSVFAPHFDRSLPNIDWDRDS